VTVHRFVKKCLRYPPRAPTARARGAAFTPLADIGFVTSVVFPRNSDTLECTYYHGTRVQYVRKSADRGYTRPAGTTQCIRAPRVGCAAAHGRGCICAAREHSPLCFRPSRVRSQLLRRSSCEGILVLFYRLLYIPFLFFPLVSVRD
jgi:hypothetical protein